MRPGLFCHTALASCRLPWMPSVHCLGRLCSALSLVFCQMLHTAALNLRQSPNKSTCALHDSSWDWAEIPNLCMPILTTEQGGLCSLRGSHALHAQTCCTRSARSWSARSGGRAARAGRHEHAGRRRRPARRARPDPVRARQSRPIWVHVGQNRLLFPALACQHSHVQHSSCSRQVCACVAHARPAGSVFGVSGHCVSPSHVQCTSTAPDRSLPSCAGSVADEDWLGVALRAGSPTWARRTRC